MQWAAPVVERAVVAILATGAPATAPVVCLRQVINITGAFDNPISDDYNIVALASVRRLAILTTGTSRDSNQAQEHR